MVTFINRFTVHGPGPEFEECFARTSEFMRRQPGFLGHRLMRSLRAPEVYVNIARWADEDAFRAATAHREFAGHAAALRALASTEPSLFETVLDGTP